MFGNSEAQAWWDEIQRNKWAIFTDYMKYDVQTAEIIRQYIKYDYDFSVFFTLAEMKYIVRDLISKNVYNDFMIADKQIQSNKALHALNIPHPPFRQQYQFV